MPSATQIVLLAGIAYGAYVLLSSTAKPRSGDVFMQHPTIIPTQTIPGISPSQDEVAKFQHDMQTGQLKDSQTGIRYGAQFW